MNPDLLTRAERISNDINQLPEAREVIRELIAALSEAESSCPYIRDGNCELAEPMFARAWQRELGELIPKVHLIDSLVLTTQKLKREHGDFQQRISVLQDALRDAVYTVASSGKGSIGSIDNVHLAQVGVERVGRWREVLTGLRQESDEPVETD